MNLSFMHTMALCSPFINVTIKLYKFKNFIIASIYVP